MIKLTLFQEPRARGKAHCFEMFVDFLPAHLLKSRKVVIAHGVEKHGDNVFHAFKDQFEHLTEDDFVDFWCIYLTSLAHEQFVKGKLYQELLRLADGEIQRFRESCAKAHIPEIKARKSLSDILAWTLNVLRTWTPRLKYQLPQDAGEVELDLFGKPAEAHSAKAEDKPNEIPRFITDVKDRLNDILKRTDLSIWLMTDRLDEIFPRRSDLETRALRGLLRTMRLFSSDTVRIKIFLRDDMLEEVVSTREGFTALTHITARRADTLQWSEDQIFTMLAKRLFADESMAGYFKIDKDRLNASQEYRLECLLQGLPTYRSQRIETEFDPALDLYSYDGW